MLPAANRRVATGVSSVAEREKSPSSISLMVLLGSGGHTGEMLRVLDQWEHLERFKIHFVISSGDETSLQKIKHASTKLTDNCTVDTIHRARDVGHGKLSATINTVISFFDCIQLVWKLNPDVFLSNGPGTAIPLAYSSFIMKFLGLGNTTIVYVESLARVKSLSLTGKLILPIANRILVQWPELAKRYPRCEYKGILV